MIKEVIDEIGFEETYRNICEQRHSDDLIWLLWWTIQMEINQMMFEETLKWVRKEGLI